MGKSNALTRAQILAHCQRMEPGPVRDAALAQLGLRTASAATAVANPERPAGGPGSLPRHVAGRMNKTEAAYARRLDALMAAGEVARWSFEAVRLLVARGGGSGRASWYTPDFAVWRPDGRMTLDEVKGPYVTDAGLLRWRAAAEAHPLLHLRFLQRGRDGSWSCERESNGASGGVRPV